MTFAERARQAQSVKGPPCLARVWLDSLDPAYRAEVLEALADKSITTSAIIDLLRADRHDVSRSSITRHRNRGCRCGAPA